MRKIVNSTFVSLDGVIENMEAWHFDFVDKDTERITGEQIDAADILLMGRRTYEVYHSAWPNREGSYPDRINAIRKYVASTTLDTAEWNNTSVISGDLVEEVRRLKAEEGDGDILMHGFGPVARALLAAGLLDELFLWVHPQFAGVGTVQQMLFSEGNNARLELLDARPLASGVVTLSYRPIVS
jgi:dihydrofolate reductase